MDKKKYVVVHGSKEKRKPSRVVREKEELSLVQDLVTTLLDGSEEVKKEIEEAYRLRNYMEGGARHMKIKFKFQITVNDIMN